MQLMVINVAGMPIPDNEEQGRTVHALKKDGLGLRHCKSKVQGGMIGEVAWLL